MRAINCTVIPAKAGTQKQLRGPGIEALLDAVHLDPGLRRDDGLSEWLRHTILLRSRVPLDHVSFPPIAFDRRDFKLDQRVKSKGEKARIRCPVCRWNPTKSSRWYCLPMGSPENFNGGCGKSWHTFDTRGLCPSCSYQWKHTTCLRCGSTSVHEDWYEKEKKSE